MSENEPPATGHVNFDAPAVLRKWPSLKNQRSDAPSPYLLMEDTLDECIRQYLSKPPKVRHLYEIYTSPQPPMVSAVLSEEIATELARLRDFL